MKCLVITVLLAGVNRCTLTDVQVAPDCRVMQALCGRFRARVFRKGGADWPPDRLNTKVSSASLSLRMHLLYRGQELYEKTTEHETVEGAQ